MTLLVSESNRIVVERQFTNLAKVQSAKIAKNGAMPLKPNNMQKNKKAKKSAKKVSRKVTNVRHEILVRVAAQEIAPTVSQLIEPIRDGKKLTIPATWMSEKQLVQVLGSTPKQHVYRRVGKGGQTFDYVTGNYITKALNFIFGWNWDFEIVDKGIEGGQVWVQGRLTVRGNKPGEQIVKVQFGRADIKYRRGTKDMLDYGNDLKAAATDAKKKCASELGIASDIYGKADHKEETGQEVRDDTPRLTQGEPVIKQGDPSPKEPTIDYICQGTTKTGCGNDLTKIEYEYSIKHFNRPFCRSCQQEAKRK